MNASRLDRAIAEKLGLWYRLNPGEPTVKKGYIGYRDYQYLMAELSRYAAMIPESQKLECDFTYSGIEFFVLQRKPNYLHIVIE